MLVPKGSLLWDQDPCSSVRGGREIRGSVVRVVGRSCSRNWRAERDWERGYGRGRRAEEQSCAGERRKIDDVGSLVEDGGGGWGFRKRGSCFPRLMQVQDFQVSAARSKDRTRPGRDQARQDTGPHKRESGPNQTRGERE
jgi:hypothetical protein